MAVKIKSYRIRKTSSRGSSVTLPKVWVDDLNLKPGDQLDFYRDENDRLIIERPGVTKTGGAE